jgi:hypothetical protein
MALRRREIADYVFETYQFPYEYADANGWTVLENERVFFREIFLLEEWNKDSVCYILKIEFEHNSSSIKTIELTKLNK